MIVVILSCLVGCFSYQILEDVDGFISERSCFVEYSRPSGNDLVFTLQLVYV